MQAFVPGIYPRSEELVQATRDLDRGRTTQEAVDAQVDRDLEQLVAVQQDAGLDLLSDGMLRWQDLFRPLVEAADGLEGVKRALKPLGLEPVALGTVQRNTVDVAKAVAEIVPKGPDAVVQISAYKSCAAFIREARKAGYGGTFFNVSFVGTQALADELGREGRGIMVSQVMPFPFSTTTPISL